MNRRAFLRSGAVFGVGAALVPKLAFALPAQPEQPLVLDYEPGCPGFAVLLEDLCVGFRKVFGEAVTLSPESADYQFLTVMAVQQCDLYCQMDALWRSYTPVTATGAGLDRRTGETDEEVRTRMVKG